MANRFSSAKNSIAECDRCGFRFKLKDLKKLVVKTKTFNTLVCSNCWDPDHPQLQLGMYPVSDPQGVRDPRPDRSYITSGLNSAGNVSLGSRDIQWGWNPVGGSSFFDAFLTPNYLVSQSALGQVTIDTTVICPVYEISVDTTTAGPVIIPSGCFANVYGTAVWTITYTAHTTYGTLVSPGSVVVGSSNHISGPTDPYYSYVSLLLHADGTNGSTSFLDNSPSPKTVTANGNAQISTTIPKFGTGSALFDGTGDYLQAPNSSDFNFGSGDFTVEFWANPASVSVPGYYQALVSYSTGTISATNLAFYIYMYNTSVYVSAYVGSTSYDAATTPPMTVGVWTYIAAVRSGANLTLFINGVATASVSLGSLTLNNPANAVLQVGQIHNTGPFNGKIDDLRITKGIARYTANFTPPTAAFPNQ